MAQDISTTTQEVQQSQAPSRAEKIENASKQVMITVAGLGLAAFQLYLGSKVDNNFLANVNTISGGAGVLIHGSLGVKTTTARILDVLAPQD